MITVTAINPRHTKDQQPLVITEFFLTTEKELMLKGYCSKCHVEVTLLISLDELKDQCPDPPGLTLKDISDLHQMGISVPIDPPLSLPAPS